MHGRRRLAQQIRRRTITFAYAIEVQTYINGFPMMDLYRTLWGTSFDPERGHDRTLNEFFLFCRLITSKDGWVVTPNEDTIDSRAFMDLRKEPIILVIPPKSSQYWVPVSDIRHDFRCQPVMGDSRRCYYQPALRVKWKRRITRSRLVCKECLEAIVCANLADCNDSLNSTAFDGRSRPQRYCG